MKSHSTATSIIYGTIRRILRPFIQGIWIKKVTGLHNIPRRGSAILAMNHQSFFDFLTLSVVCPRNIHFLAAEKFFYHPVWKHIMMVTGQIKVERTSTDKAGVHQLVETHVQKNTLLGIFPEGTRSESKTHMLKAYTGIAKYALTHRIPIIPVGIIGADDVLSKTGKKVNTAKVIEIHIGEALHFDEYFEKEISKETCTLVTEKVMKKISNLSNKIYTHYEFDNN